MSLYPSRDDIALVNFVTGGELAYREPRGMEHARNVRDARRAFGKPFEVWSEFEHRLASKHGWDYARRVIEDALSSKKA